MEPGKGAIQQDDILFKGAADQHQPHRHDLTLKIKLFNDPRSLDHQPSGRGVRSPVPSNSARIRPARMVLSGAALFGPFLYL